MAAIVGRPTSLEDAAGDLAARLGEPTDPGGGPRRGFERRRAPGGPARSAAEPVDQVGGTPLTWFELWAPDLEPMLRRATELGAVVELQRTNLPSGNAMAIIRDACGNRLGLWAS